MRGLGLALALICLLPAAGRAAGVAPAETMLFMDDHLGSVRPPAHLVYTFEDAAQGAPTRAGELDLTLARRADRGCCAVTAEEKGDGGFPLPPVSEAKANPVILYFLEREIRQMQGMTGGQSSYFRRLIRLALAQSAQISAVTVRYQGRDLPAREISISPYLDAPRREQYAPLAGKRYAFVLAKGVPGGVYQIRGLVPAKAVGAAPAAQSTLTLSEERSK